MFTFEVDATVNNLSDELKSEFRDWAKKGADKGFAVSQENAPQDRGTLLQSGRPPQFTSDGRLIWGYNANYAKPMEFGTDPFYPPVKPLVEWAKRVAGDPGLGYYVAKVKIPTEGISESPYVRPGRDAQKQWYQSHPFSEKFED